MWSSLRWSSWRDSSFAAAAGTIRGTTQGLCHFVLRSFCYDSVCLKHNIFLEESRECSSVYGSSCHERYFSYYQVNMLTITHLFTRQYYIRNTQVGRKRRDYIEK